MLVFFAETLALIGCLGAVLLAISSNFYWTAVVKIVIMKVIFDYQVFDWQEYGGISRYYYELANLFIRNDLCKLKIIAPMHTNKYIVNLDNDVVFGIYFPRINRTNRIRTSINMLITKVMIDIIYPDILHETYYSTHHLARPRTKTVITVFDMIHEKYPEFFNASEKEMQHIKYRAINRADHIICISENTRKDLIELTGIDSSRTSVIHLGYSLTKYISDTSGTLISHPFILFVGQRGRYKNFYRLLRAYAASSRLLRDFNLICFGGYEFSSDELTLIDSLGLKNKVIRSRGSDQVLANYYSNAAALVFPSLYEGFGLPLLEAMSYQCPVVCSKASSMPEVAGDAAEYFDPYLVDSIKCAIEKIVYSSERSNNLIARGLARIKHFSWKQCADETFSIYRSLL